MGMRQILLHTLRLLKAYILPALICLVITSTTHAQDTTTTTQDTPAAPAQTGAYPDSITSFTQFDLPPEMITEFLHMDPKTVLLYHNEFQMLHNGIYGQAEVVIKVWYIDDRIIGYLIETPFDHIGGAHTLKRKINIPVKWACIPTVEGHEEHIANSLNQLRNISAESKCTGWHIQLPDEYEPGPQIKYQKRKPVKPQVGDFGKAQITDHKEDRKKARKNAFKEQDTAPAAADSTGTAKPVKDSIPK